ncbi:MAG TPA: glycosyltransferase [Nocardioides sp.]|nr:glycosyltransferase [Nocardioides sp.]
MTALVRRMWRRVPAVAKRDARLAELDDEVGRLRRAATRRGAGPEQWSAPDRETAVEIVRTSGLFDAEWYLSQVDDPGAAADDPLGHYLADGAATGLSPHPAFVASWYLEQIRAKPGYGSRPKIAEAPLVHYLTAGARRRLSPHPGFDAEVYLRENPDSEGERFGPLAHFLRSSNRTCAPVEDLDPNLPQGPPATRRTSQEFLASARHAAVAIRDARGYSHLERDHTDFDYAAEAELKESLHAAASSLPDRPLVSVLLPTKDRATVVTNAIASVLTQSYSNVELVIVDDGSTDETVDVLGAFLNDPRVEYLRHEESRGVAAARNTALGRARGDLIAYLDSDNTWRPDFLELMVAFMVTRGHRVGYAMSALTEHGGQGRSLVRGMPFSRGALMERNYIDCIALVHERGLLETTGTFDETLRRNVDWDLFIRMARETDFGFLPVIATEYDPWEKRMGLTSTEEPPSYRQLVRQRTLVDWEAVGCSLPERDPDLVSLVVVATETASPAVATMHRALATAARSIEVVVVDTHMPDHEGTRLVMATESLPHTHVRRLSGEVSVEVARNVGASLARGGTLVFMAENAWCERNWDAPLVDALATHPAVQPLLLTNGGTVWSAGLHFLTNGDSVNVHQDLPGDAPEVRDTRPVDAAVNACLAVRADRFVEASGFDPLFVDHLSGGELSIRVADHGNLDPACVGASRVALREADVASHPRVLGSPSQRDNDRLQRELWNGRPSKLARRLEDDGYELAGVLSSGRPSQPCSALLVRGGGEGPLRWSIKIGAPDVPHRESWGDWHFAEALRDSLERLGHHVTIDCQQEWYRPTARLDNVTLVLRGLGNYRPNPLHTNLVWVISHPERVSARELDGFDLVFGASARWCERIGQRRAAPVELLMQCTDDRRFHPVDPDAGRRHELLVVANARGGRVPSSRASVESALAAGLVPAVYGRRWEGLLPAGAWRGPYLPNDELPAVYAAADAVLNDHWEDMREEGMLSNRLFDLTACNARVISDHLPEIADVFGDVVLTFQRPDEIPDLLRKHQSESEEHRRAREALGEHVRREHTFDARARVLSARVATLRAASARS